jgi:hypothetical protein
VIEAFTGVIFRREKNYLEVQQEVEKAMEKGERLDPKDVDRWHIMGDTMLVTLPAEGSYVFLNGSQYRIKDITWSLALPERMGQPVDRDPLVMITVAQESPGSGYVPTEDFSV